MTSRKNIIYLSHGGGPLPLLGHPDHEELVQALVALSKQFEKPSAILVISAHWETSVPSITAQANPSLLYDYYGFPEESYAITYPVPGDPDLAKSMFDALKSYGIGAELNQRRGLDHGVFVPLKIMYPEADIPCVQLSLLHSLDPSQHIALGEALKDLPYDNLLIIGSGFSFHNMAEFFNDDGNVRDEKNEAFQNWLLETMSDKTMGEGSRKERLVNWLQAPSARYCHPREEHLLPLHVCYGVAARSCDKAYALNVMKKQSMIFHWSD